MRTLLRRVILVGLVVVASGPARLQASTTIPIEVVGDRFVVVQVSVNGHAPDRFLLDTGSTISVVDRATARRLGLEVVGSRLAVTHTDARDVPLVGPVSLALGPLEVNDLTIFVLDVPVLQPGRCRVSGVLGQDVLARFSYLLDYRNRRLELDVHGRLASELIGTRVALQVTRGFPTVRTEAVTRVDDEAIPLDLALDSGAASLMVFEGDRVRDERLVPNRQRRAVVVRSMHGSRYALQSEVRTLVVGTERLAEVPLTLIPRPDGWRDRPAVGLLPTSLFDAIFVDNRERVVIFNPVGGGALMTDITDVPPLP